MSLVARNGALAEANIMGSKKPMPKPGHKLIFRKSMTTKKGKVIYAWQYGKKAFVFEVPVGK